MDRVVIGKHYPALPDWKRYLGTPLIFVPIFITVPFVLLAVLTIKLHLRLMGARDIRGYWSFLPTWASHRYTYANQPVFITGTTIFHLCRYRWYWIFNCKLYCPMSVALFAYCTYLVKIVENWWCPFVHDKKTDYADGAIDKSFWHSYPDEYVKLHPNDQNNPVWNEDTEQ